MKYNIVMRIAGMLIEPNAGLNDGIIPFFSVGAIAGGAGVKVVKGLGRLGKQKRLKELMYDSKVSSRMDMTIVIFKI